MDSYGSEGSGRAHGTGQGGTDRRRMLPRTRRRALLGALTVLAVTGAAGSGRDGRAARGGGSEGQNWPLPRSSPSAS